jgi:hypothetical protein
MKFCPVVPEVCRGQVHGARKERRITRTRRIIIIIIIINKKRSKNNKSPNVVWGMSLSIFTGCTILPLSSTSTCIL